MGIKYTFDVCRKNMGKEKKLFFFMKKAINLNELNNSSLRRKIEIGEAEESPDNLKIYFLDTPYSNVN